MKVSYNAALLSGFVFPGVGYLSLKLYRKALVVISVSAVCFAGLIQSIFIKVRGIMDLVVSGEVTPDVSSMLVALQEIAQQNAGWQDYAGYGFALCWALSIVDAVKIAERKVKQED